MPSEAGDMKLIGNFRKLIDQVSADATYNLANPALTVAALEAQYAAALAAVESVSAKLVPNKIATGERVTAFEAMGKLVTRSRNLLKASGASQEVLSDAETSVRKILGRRKSSKAQVATPAADAPWDPLRGVAIPANAVGGSFIPSLHTARCCRTAAKSHQRSWWILHTSPMH